MKEVFLTLLLLVICLFYGALGVYTGIKYEQANQHTETHYVYKNKCIAIYKGAVLPYDCMDSTIESK